MPKKTHSVVVKKEAKEEKAVKFMRQTIELKSNVERGFLEIGARLSAIKEKELWKGQWEDFDHFCRDGMKLAEKTANKMMLIFRKFIEEYQIEPDRIAAAGGWTVIDTITSVVHDKESAVKWLQIAESMPREDVRKLVREANKPVDSIECKHKNVRRVILQICEDCGDKQEVYED